MIVEVYIFKIHMYIYIIYYIIYIHLCVKIYDLNKNKIYTKQKNQNKNNY